MQGGIIRGSCTAAFIASSAVLVTLRDKVDLARITTPPAQILSPSPIVSSPSLYSGLPFAEPEDFRSNALPQDFGSLEWFDSDLAAPTPGPNYFKDYQQQQDSSSEVSYSWPEALPVEDEPSNEDSNEDSNALQDQDQSEFNGEFEDFTITLPPIVHPATSDAARTGYFSLISYVGEYFFGNGRLDQSKLKSESGAASSNEDPSQSPVAPVWNDFYGGAPSPNQPWMAAFFSLCFLLGLLTICFVMAKNGQKISFDQPPAEVKFALFESRIDALVKSHKAADETRVEEIKTSKEKLGAQDKTVERAYQELRKRDDDLDERDEEIRELKKQIVTLKEALKHEGNEDMGKLKEDVASLSAENNELPTPLGRESETNVELRRLLDTANAHTERLKGSLAKNEQEIREAHEAKFQAVTEASEARKQAEASRAAAGAAQLELDAERAELESVQLQLAKFKDDARNETRIAMAREKADILKITSLEKAFAESEEKRASVQEEADGALADLESQLNALKKALAESEEKRASVQEEAEGAFADLESQLNVLKEALAESEEKRASIQEEADGAFADLESQVNVLKKALAESEEKRASAQKEADGAPVELESQLNAEKLANENLVYDSARALALQTQAKVEATPLNFEASENSSAPVQPSGEAAVPTPVVEPQSSPAEDGLVPSSAPAPTSNPSGQSWRPPLSFTLEVPRKTSFPKSEPGLFNISFGKESAGLAQQTFDAVASCGGTDHSKSNSMELSDSTPSTASGGSIFGPGSATLPTHFNGPNLASSTASLEGPAEISQQPGAPIIQPDNLAWAAQQLIVFLQTGVTLQPYQDPSLAGAASFFDQDPNAVASQDMGALSSYGGGDNSGLNSMAMGSSTTSSTASNFGFNAPAANPPMAVDATFGASTNAALGNPDPIGQRFAGGPQEEIYNSIIALAPENPSPLPSQDATSTEVSPMTNQQWGALQPTPNPSLGMSLGQEQSFDPNAVSQTSTSQNAQPALWNGQPPPQQHQDQLWQQGFGAYTDVPPTPNHFLGSSQSFNFQFNPQTVSQLGNTAVQPNPPTMHPTSGPLTESGPDTISPLVFYNEAHDTRYFTGNSPFAMGPIPYHNSAPPPTSYNPLAAPTSVPPVNQIPETTPIDSSQTGDWSAQYSAPVVENNYTQPSYNGPAGDDEVSLGEDDGDQDWRQCHASLSGFRESAPSPEFEWRGPPAGQDPQEGDWDKFEDDLDSYSDPGAGDVIVPISPPLNSVSEGDLPPAADTPRLIKRLPRSLRRAQVNEAGQFPNGTPVAAEAVADEGESSGAWGATDDDQEPPTPPKTASGERAIRALPKSRRRPTTSQLSIRN